MEVVEVWGYKKLYNNFIQMSHIQVTSEAIFLEFNSNILSHPSNKIFR